MTGDPRPRDQQWLHQRSSLVVDRDDAANVLACMWEYFDWSLLPQQLSLPANQYYCLLLPILPNVKWILFSDY